MARRGLLQLSCLQDDAETRERLERFGLLECLEQVLQGTRERVAVTGWAPHHASCFAQLLWDCFSHPSSSVSSSSSLVILEHLSLEACHLRDADVAAMPRQWPALRRLSLAGNELTTVAAQTLAGVGDSGVDGSEASASTLSSSLHGQVTSGASTSVTTSTTKTAMHMPVLQELDLGWNKIGDAGGEALLARYGAQLTVLDLSGMRVVRCKAPTFTFTVPRRRRWGQRLSRQRGENNPRRINLLSVLRDQEEDDSRHSSSTTSSSTTEEGTTPPKEPFQLGIFTCRALGRDARPLPHLTHLRLNRQTKLGADGIEALATAMRDMPCLQELSLQGCLVDDFGVKALAEALPHAGALERLDLSKNHMTDIGAISLVSNLDKTAALHDIRLVQNRMGLMGLNLLCGAIYTNLQLVHVTVSGHEAGVHVAADTIERIRRGLQSNRRIQRVLQESKNMNKFNALAILPELVAYIRRHDNTQHNRTRILTVLRTLRGELASHVAVA